MLKIDPSRRRRTSSLRGKMRIRTAAGPPQQRNLGGALVGGGIHGFICVMPQQDKVRTGLRLAPHRARAPVGAGAGGASARRSAHRARRVASLSAAASALALQRHPRRAARRPHHNQ